VALSPAFLIVGYLTFSASSSFRPRNAGRIMIGLGLMLLALKLIVAASEPMREAPITAFALESLGSEPFLAVLAGALITWFSYSSLVAILLITSFMAGGVLDLQTAFALILGVNFGAGIPALMSTLAQPAKARRLPLANLICRALLALSLLPVLPAIVARLAEFSIDPIWLAVGFHAGFNLLLAAVGLPLTAAVIAVVSRLLPDRQDRSLEPDEPRYLDHDLLTTPPAALANALAEAARMTEILGQMFQVSASAISDGRLDELKSIRLLDDRLNHFHQSIHSYLAAIGESELTDGMSRRVHETMLFISNLEHAGDIIDLSLTERIKAKAKQSITFNPEQEASLSQLAETVAASLRIAVSVLNSGDITAARKLIDQKASFRAHEQSVIEDQFRENDASDTDGLKAGALYIDLIRDLHQINSHIVSVAYPVLEEAGLLRETRVRNKKKSKDRSLPLSPDPVAET
ncbi:MAG: Na/Pi symporter, partial [Pseudomonadota bacterium]